MTESGAVASDCKAEVVYGVFPDHHASALTVACLRTALLNTQCSRLSDAPGVFIGDLGSSSASAHEVGKRNFANAPKRFTQVAWRWSILAVQGVHKNKGRGG